MLKNLIYKLHAEGMHTVIFDKGKLNVLSLSQKFYII